MRILLIALIVSIAALGVRAEWSNDPENNLVLADGPGPQDAPKIVPTADGGFYVSWLDGSDLRLQRLNVAGDEQWPHNGLLIAESISESTATGYSLSIDTAGCALLAYQINPPGPGYQVIVAKVDPEGDLIWGADGVVVSSVASGFRWPRVVGTTDGSVVVSWTGDGAVLVQKLDPDGAALWSGGVSLVLNSGELRTRDIGASSAGHVILSFTQEYSDHRFHLWAQKLDSVNGASMWRPGHVPVYDEPGESVWTHSSYYRPSFITDGQGGAVFFWETMLPSSQCRVQRILLDGTEAFPHQGVEVSTDGRFRGSPSAVLLPDESIAVFWSEIVHSAFVSGLFGQRIDSNGARLWTDSGIELVPRYPDQVMNVAALPCDDGALIAWVNSIYATDEPVYAMRVNSDGDYVWSPPNRGIGVLPTGSYELVGTLSTRGFAAFVWRDGGWVGDYESDVLAQNIYPDGSLGSRVVFQDGFECGTCSAWSNSVP